MPKVSIIVPMYNVENYIEKCILSCINQTFNNIEIILIDDGSSDNTLNIAKKYATKDNRITLLEQENEGVSVARNKGIEISRGKWIVFVDGDDWLEEKAIEKMYEIAKNNDYDIIISGFYANYINYEKKCFFLNVESDSILKVEKVELIKTCLYKTSLTNPNNSASIGVPWAKMYNKNYLITKNITFRIGLKRMQDMIFNLDALYQTNNIYYFNSPLYHYRIQFNSATRKYTADFYNTSIKILNCIKDFINRNHLENDLKDFYTIKAFLLYNEIIKLQYAKKDNPIKIHKKIKELRNILNDEVYYIIQKNNIDKFLNLKYKIINFFIKRKIVFPIYILYVFTNYIKNINMYK